MRMESYIMKEFTPDPDSGERWLNLWREAQAGNHQAEDQLLGEVRPFLKAAVQQHVRGQAQGAWDASDIVQALCMKLLLPGPELRGTTGREFLAWLQTIVRNEFLDTVRAGKAQKRGGGQLTGPLPEDSRGGEMLAGDASTPSQKLMRQEDYELLEEAMGRLSSDHQQVIRLRCSPEKLTWAEIASRMGRTEDAVKQLFRRAFDQLREEMRAKP
jgi:RNA polymerase sigma factor (sigma-70 family)